MKLSQTEIYGTYRILGILFLGLTLSRGISGEPGLTLSRGISGEPERRA